MNSVRRASTAAATVALLLSAAGSARAATRTWDGSDSNDWSDGDNWSGNAVPNSGDDVVIGACDSNILIDTNIDVQSITVNGSCANTIRPNPATNTIRVRNNVTLSATAAGGIFRLSSGTTQIGGQLTRTNTNMALDTNAGTLIFNAASGSVIHTLNGATVDTVIFNDGLVGYWTLDETASPFADGSGYGNTGTLTGTYAAPTPPTLLFSNAGALTFNGATNVSLGTTNLPAANAAQTISVWANFSSATATQTMVAMTGTFSAIRFGLGGGNVRVLNSAGTTLAQVAAPSAGGWHHITYVYDPSQATAANRDRIYVNGTVSAGTGTAHNTATPTAAFLGATTAANANPYTGSLDEVRIYNRALTAAEVLAMAQGRLPGTGVATHTLSGAFATVDNNAQLIIASGIVTGSSTITAHGDWLNYGGRFTGTGTVSLTAGAARTLLTGGQPFRNLTVNASGTYTLADRLWVSETPGVASTGILSILQGQSLNGGGYTMHVGTVDDQSTNANGFMAATDGTLVLDGSASQNLGSRFHCGLRIEDPTETNLVGYWKLDQGQGTTVRESISNNAGTMSSAGSAWSAASTTISFDNATAMTFTGSSSGYVSAGGTGLPAANVAQTISVWANFSSATATQSMVALTATGSAIRLGLGGGAVQVLNSGGTVLATATAPSAGAWHHIAYVYDPSQATAANRDRIYIDGTATTGTSGAHNTATPTATFIGATSAGANFYTGSLDDVRVYNAALTSAQVTSLAAGRYAGTGGMATVTLTGGDTNLPQNATSGCNGGLGRGLSLDSGNLYTSDLKLTVKLTSSPVLINSGTLHIGSDVVNLDGGLTVNPMGALLMDEAAGQLQPGVNSTVTIDGSFTASNTGAIVQRDNGGERYAFTVGSVATARPVLNIAGLAIRDVDANGLRINANTSAVTTFTRFDNIIFRRGTGTYLNVYATSLYLASSGCQFGIGDAIAALPANNVTLTGNGTADGETRIVFGSATCHANQTTNGYCNDSWTIDDDANNDGVGDPSPTGNEAVVQYVRGAGTDTAGTVEGQPTAAFDWNTFAYYSTYVAFRDVSGTVDRVYVRTQTGAAEYSWDTPSGEQIVGTPRWNTGGTTHYLYVATASGKIYRLIDNGTSLVQDGSGSWAGAANPFDCACTIVTPLAANTTNLYWGGIKTSPVGQRIWTMSQSTQAQPVGSPFLITPTITSAAPALWTDGTTNYFFIGLTGNLIKLNVSNQTLNATNTSPGSASVVGRISTSTTRIFAADSAGNVWAFDPNNFTGTNRVWRHTVGGTDTIQGSLLTDQVGGVIHFGTEQGKVGGVSITTGVTQTGYPFVPGTTSDAIRSPPLYLNGILLVGTTTGKLFIYDRNNGTTGPAFIKQYFFGPTQAVSGVSYDSNVQRYMVATADPTTKDGRVYFIDAITDPTAAK